MIPKYYEHDAQTLHIPEYKDVGDWLNENILDFSVLLGSRKDILEMHLAVTIGGPNVWYILDGTEFVRIRYCEPFKSCEEKSVHNPYAKELFEVLRDYLEETWLQA